MAIQSGFTLPKIERQPLLTTHPNHDKRSESLIDLSSAQDPLDAFQPSASQSPKPDSPYTAIDFDQLIDYDKFEEELDLFCSQYPLDLDSSGSPVEAQKNPFRDNSVVLPAQIELPPKHSQEADTKQPAKKRKRPSRHPQYSNVLTSEKTDDELESTDKQLSKKTRLKLNQRKSRVNQARKLGLSLPQFFRLEKEKAASKRGLTVPEYEKQKRQAAAKKRSVSKKEQSQSAEKPQNNPTFSFYADFKYCMDLLKNRPLTPINQESATLAGMVWNGNTYRPVTPPNSWSQRFPNAFKNQDANYCELSGQPLP
jgi:hypothetical protein